MADVLEKFVKDVKDEFGGNLKSVILYGSRVSGDDAGEKSDYNVLLVLNEVSAKLLKSVGVSIRIWMRMGNPAPLIFTQKTLERSADVFPMEFMDIKDNRRVLYGLDPFAGLRVDDAYLRHECEFELKGKYLRLQQGYAAAANPEDARKLLVDSVSTFLVIFRQIVRLLGRIPPVAKRASLTVLATEMKIETSVFETVYAMKSGDKDALKQDPDALMDRYMREIEKVIDIVDNMHERKG